MIKLFNKNNYKLSIIAIALLVIAGFALLTDANQNPIKLVSNEVPKKNIIIYNTHMSEAYDFGGSVRDAAIALNKKLSRLGVGSTYLEIPRDLDRSKSFEISRKIVTNNTKNYGESILLDIHRDIAEPSRNLNYLLVVLGRENPNFTENKKFADSLLAALEKINGIKADIYIKKNGIFNQDLSKEAILINIGQKSSSKQDIEMCVNALGEALGKVTQGNKLP